ncbi:hypothetical protein DBZ36_17730 [Alginatibacterium sediminis]|uniref:Uncharacterized protein n=1 Tax=Alginatibacterium sediminis TaxID=2164068 RepID=A0A420E7M9_9ALTE|nr:hypothetical protein [Alginatibacterium sediminis]RKF14491.1 hypothetical protein DBZ36_17730 [Alginatibacterium sediminis]
MKPNVVDNHQEVFASLEDAFFAHKAALFDECAFVMFDLKPLFYLVQIDNLKSQNHFLIPQ